MCTAGCPRNMRETPFFRKILLVAHYIVQNWVSRPNIDDFRHPTWTYYKVFEKMPEKCGKNLRKNFFFSTLVFDSKTISQFRPACKKSERNL